MSYFMINGIDFSNYLNELKIKEINNYNAQVNASGNTVVDYINTKREITVGIIPIEEADMKKLQTEISKFSITLSFRNPKTNELESGVQCIIPNSNIEYYTIQASKISYKAFNLTFIEL